MAHGVYSSLSPVLMTVGLRYKNVQPIARVYRPNCPGLRCKMLRLPLHRADLRNRLPVGGCVYVADKDTLKFTQQ